jgi:transcriptional regulator with XRE-family HTH domain
MQGTQRQGGVLLDADRLDHQLGLRGISRRRLCELSGVAEPTLSRALHGRPIYPGTLRKLTRALLEAPLLLGADLVIAQPKKKEVAGDGLTATSAAS